MNKASSKSTSYAISSRLQVTFTVLLFVAGVTGLLLPLHYVLLQLPNNSNLSAYMPLFLQGIIWPVFVFLVPLLIGLQRKMLLSSRLFESSLLATIAILALMGLTSLMEFMEIILGAPYYRFATAESYMLIILGQMLVVGAVYTFAVVRYQRSRK